MKKETKALVEWIAAQIKIAAKLDNSYLITPGATITHKSLEEDAERFLNSLPEIEEKLCFGGYIQDKNGTPCCQGDKVKYKDIPVDKVGAGTLRWNVDKSRFEIYWEDEDLKGLIDTMNIKTDFAPRDIEKVENDD